MAIPEALPPPFIKPEHPTWTDFYHTPVEGITEKNMSIINDIPKANGRIRQARLVLSGKNEYLVPDDVPNNVLLGVILNSLGASREDFREEVADDGGIVRSYPAHVHLAIPQRKFVPDTVDVWLQEVHRPPEGRNGALLALRALTYDPSEVPSSQPEVQNG